MITIYSLINQLKFVTHQKVAAACNCHLVLASLLLRVWGEHVQVDKSSFLAILNGVGDFDAAANFAELIFTVPTLVYCTFVGGQSTTQLATEGLRMH